MPLLMEIQATYRGKIMTDYGTIRNIIQYGEASREDCHCIAPHLTIEI